MIYVCTSHFQFIVTFFEPCTNHRWLMRKCQMFLVLVDLWRMIRHLRVCAFSAFKNSGSWIPLHHHMSKPIYDALSTNVIPKHRSETFQTELNVIHARRMYFWWLVSLKFASFYWDFGFLLGMIPNILHFSCWWYVFFEQIELQKQCCTDLNHFPAENALQHIWWHERSGAYRSPWETWGEWWQWFQQGAGCFCWCFLHQLK